MPATAELSFAIRSTTGSVRLPTVAEVRPAQDNLPAARLTRLANNLADQQPPVDVARVAALRTAIAGGNYGVHPAIIASAMLDFNGRGTE